MKYIHKYVADGKTLFLLTDSPTKASGTFSVKQEDWQGRALGRFSTVAGQLEKLSFTKEEKVVEEKEETGKVEEKEKTPKKACVSNILRDLASTIQE